LCLALLGASIAGGCGIPQFSFLAAPELQDSIPLPPAVTFSHDPSNDVDGFRGYEIYYKFYGSENAQTSFANDRASVEAAGPQNATTILRQRGFYRVFAEGSSDIPAIEIGASERALEFDVLIEFQFDAGGEPARATWDATGPESQELVRDQSIFGPSDGEPGFAAADLVPDAHEDVPASSEIGQSGTVDMAVVILSYGIDFDIFSQVYSQPVVVDQLLRIAYQ